MSIKVGGGQDWSLEKIQQVIEEIDKIWEEKYSFFSLYPSHIEIITSEQMLDGHSSVAMPIMYNHWSFGEQFVRELEAYKKGQMGLAFEVVLNSNPCIVKLMEDNTMVIQTLVVAHAKYGHNTFMKNNYLFKEWTDASFILDYLEYAKKYIRECEEKYGIDEVEEILDACHSLKYNSLDKYKRPAELSKIQEKEREIARNAYNQSQVNELWNTIPKTEEADARTERFPVEPEENLLYFVEKYAPKMEEWKREILRIVRKISQYFYPQMQTQVMNEGCACYFHYKLCQELYDRGIIDDGGWQEFIFTHTAVIPQFAGSRINPYALGFAMYNDIERVATNPTEEDRDWFGNQEWVGSGDYLKVIKDVIENYKDESFVLQFLTPKIIRDFRFFSLHDDSKKDHVFVSAIHDKAGYKKIREDLAKTYSLAYSLPDIQIVDVDIWKDRTMILQHTQVNDMPLESENAINTIDNLTFLWQYPVKLFSVDTKGKIVPIV